MDLVIQVSPVHSSTAAPPFVISFCGNVFYVEHCSSAFPPPPPPLSILVVITLILSPFSTITATSSSVLLSRSSDLNVDRGKSPPPSPPLLHLTPASSRLCGSNRDLLHGEDWNASVHLPSSQIINHVHTPVVDPSAPPPKKKSGFIRETNI